MKKIKIVNIIILVVLLGSIGANIYLLLTHHIYLLLSKLEKILKILQEIPNEKKRDEAVRLILQTANDTITCETLSSLLSRNPIQKEQTIKRRDETLFLKFTNKEISNMPERFRKEFILQDKVVHCLKRKSGKRTYNYMIRYRRNGLYIVATSNNLEEAKAKFITKLNEYGSGKKLYHFDKVKKIIRLYLTYFH